MIITTNEGEGSKGTGGDYDWDYGRSLFVVQIVIQIVIDPPLNSALVGAVIAALSLICNQDCRHSSLTYRHDDVTMCLICDHIRKGNFGNEADS